MIKYIQKYQAKKKIFGYDTFEGMPEPTNNDKDFKNINASDYFNNKNKLENFTSFNSQINLDQVQKNFIEATGDSKNLFLVKGKTQDTLKIKLIYQIK